MRDGKAEVLLHVNKSEQRLVLEYKVEGEVITDCDNCLSELVYPVNCSSQLIIKLTDKSEVDEVDLIHLPTNSYEINMANHFYDTVILNLPMKLLCEDSVNRKDCDADIMNKMMSEEDSDTSGNPEWQKLKDLFK